jgi:tetratricopeptide (TPR) repeat protein
MRSAHDHYSRCIDVARRHALGRIEVAHVGQRGWTFLYNGEWQQAVEEAITAVDLAAKVGHRRAEMNSACCVGACLRELGEYDQANDYLERGLRLALSLGAKAWEPEALWSMALVAMETGQTSKARRLIDAAKDIALESARAFQGAKVMGALAWIARDDATVRESALRDGEGILDEGVISHSYLLFYQTAMDTMLYMKDWARVEKYASALEDYTAAEPLEWPRFYVAKARALAAFGRGERDVGTFNELRSLHDITERVGLAAPRRALADAISAW